MNIIGLSGGIATGKTTVSHYFSQLGISIIDADIINHQLLLPNNTGYNGIIKAFPAIPLLTDKTLDKKYLRKKIFSNQKSKHILEKILHPLIKDEITSQIKNLLRRPLSPYCIVSVPLMIEAKFLPLVSALWVCDCDEKQQLERLIARDKISKSDALLILNNQLSRQQRLQYANEIIPTESITIMKEKIKYLHQQQIKMNSK